MSRVAAARASWDRWALRRRTRKALEPPLPSAYGACGAWSRCLPPARVESPECIQLGERVIIHEHVWLCVQPQPGLPAPSLRIGDRTSINRFVKIVCHDAITIGKDVVIGDRVYISDVEHEPAPEGPPRLTAPRPVVLEDRAFLGIGVVVKPGVTIGEGAYIGANAIVHDDVPPHALVVGSPGRVVRQAPAEGGSWERVSDAET